jgi:hypothetical protein
METETKAKKKSNALIKDPEGPKWQPLLTASKKVEHISSSNYCRLFAMTDGTMEHQGLTNMIGNAFSHKIIENLEKPPQTIKNQYFSNNFDKEKEFVLKTW